MNWHDPELYLFLCLLAGFAALLAITYELFSRRRKPPVILMKAAANLPRRTSRQAGKQEAERFSRLCESTKDLPPKEQASRLRKHFGIFGGVRGPFHDGAEQAKKSLPTQIHTRRGSAARTTLTYTPLAVGGDKQTFGAEQQVPHVSGSYKKRTAARCNSSGIGQGYLVPLRGQCAAGLFCFLPPSKDTENVEAVDDRGGPWLRWASINLRHDGNDAERGWVDVSSFAQRPIFSCWGAFTPWRAFTNCWLTTTSITH